LSVARAIWSGSISFGLLNVPVKLYSAVSKQTVRFRELREGDGSRVKHKRVAESDGKEVPYEKIVKGYEYAPDQYVVLTKDELSDLEPQRSRAIEIQDFVDLDDIDPIYFEQPYYLGPDKGAERAYALLVQAMKDAHKVAVARFVLRNKEHLAAIRPMDDVLTLTTMRFHDEVSSPKDLDDVFEDAKPKKPEKKELEMATQLIDSLTSDFQPDSYRDEYREELLDLLEQKAAGKEVVSAPSEEPKPTKAPDLMAALEESLNAVRSEEAETDGKASKPKPKAKSKAKSSSSKAKSSSKSSSKSKSSSNGRKSSTKSAATKTAAGSKKAKA
jgi:DNA end-binding protein Ku